MLKTNPNAFKNGYENLADSKQTGFHYFAQSIDPNEMSHYQNKHAVGPRDHRGKSINTSSHSIKQMYGL